MIQLAAAAAAVSGGLIHGSTLNANMAQVADAYSSLLNGTSTDPNGTLTFLVNRAGLGAPGTISATSQSKDAAKKALTDLIGAGIISGPNPLPGGTPNIRDQFKLVTKAQASSQPTNASMTLSNQLPDISGQPTWVLLVVAGLLGWGVYKVIKKG